MFLASTKEENFQANRMTAMFHATPALLLHYPHSYSPPQE
jgi:hypothetical protein